MFGLALAIVAISSRSAEDSERDERPRTVCSNLSCSGEVAECSAGGAIDNPRVSGAFGMASARTICSSVTSSAAKAGGRPSNSPAPIAAVASIAAKQKAEAPNQKHEDDNVSPSHARRV